MQPITDLVNWQALLALQARLSAELDYEKLIQLVVREIAGLTEARTLLFLADDTVAFSETSLRLVAIAQGDTAEAVTEVITINAMSQSNDPAIKAWLTRSGHMTQTHDALPSLSSHVKSPHWYGLPLFVNDLWVGVLIVESSSTTVSERTRRSLEAVAPGIANTLHNNHLYTQTVANLQARNNELAILQRIDLELSEHIKPDHVFDMTLDWAVRYTGAHTGSIAVFDEVQETLRFVADLGYEATEETRTLLRETYNGGIAMRVAKSGQPELIPDISNAADYAPISAAIKSHLSVPVMHEDRVIAVLSVESRRLNHFTDRHVTFLERLTARAGNSMDNAKLFAETAAEQTKLANILANIADAVLVFGDDDRVLLMNQMAMSVLRLYADQPQSGVEIDTLLENTTLLPVYRQARSHRQSVVAETVMPDGRTYNAHFSWHDNIGCILVLQDVTSMKETETLKNELIATVSHDLKQPLTIMNGYLELLLMFQPLQGKPLTYVQNAQRSITQMRQLIDDILDLAKIESGIDLRLQPLGVKEVLLRCIDDLHAAAETKSIEITAEIDESVPKISGDPTCMKQIFVNLIGNGVKYTPPEGKVTVLAQQRGDAVLVSIKDTGLGISPEDQAKIFQRFYRVRRPETESIDGTGLGLAIVKRLVDLHHGQIGVESRLGEGSTFVVTLPVATAQP